ncbi:hypothetical protein, partial [Bacillus cereus]|uniref:hypothetical protein n=1 Tax=Bacillus cereus TaxID=1396 RepID=UPI000C027A5D
DTFYYFYRRIVFFVIKREESKKWTKNPSFINFYKMEGYIFIDKNKKRRGIFSLFTNKIKHIYN